MGMTKHSLLSFPSSHNLFSFLLPFTLSGKECDLFFTGKVNVILDYIRIYSSDDIMIELAELPPQLNRLVRPKDFKDSNHPMMTVVSLWRRIWQ